VFQPPLCGVLDMHVIYCICINSRTVTRCCGTGWNNKKCRVEKPADTNHFCGKLMNHIFWVR